MRRVAIGAGILVAVAASALLAVTIAYAQTPERSVTRYMDQIARGDAEGAARAWALPSASRLSAQADALRARRDLVTGELASARPTGYRVVGIEWWRTCCEPGIAEKPEWAGLARVRVTIELPGGARDCLFDIRREPDCCLDDPFDFRPRAWVVRDVYPATKLPLELPWVYDAAKRDSHPVIWPSEP